MELNECLDLVRDAELRAKVAESLADQQAWLKIAEAWKSLAATQAEQGGVAASIKPTREHINPPRRIA